MNTKGAKALKPFQLIPSVAEYRDFAAFAEENQLGADDLIVTNEYIYHPAISELGLSCQTLFQEHYGTGEPTDQMVNAILDKLRDRHYTRIIAVGGGTVLDIAKVLCVARKNDTVDVLYTNMKALKKVHGLILVPTTCGTGSEVTNISIINRTALGVKQGLVSAEMYAEQAALIPSMLESLPYGVFATSSIDAMIHAVESLLSPNACPLSELFSTQALRLLLPCWMRAATGTQNSWRQDAASYLRASNYAGIAFGYAGCAAVHALSYPLGSVHHVAHGESNQVMFAAVLQLYERKQPGGKMKELKALLGDCLCCDAKAALIELYALMDRILLRKPMHAYGVTRKELPDYADSVVQTQQRLLKNNYVTLSRDEILEIYESAF